jgi:hypothetical protein
LTFYEGQALSKDRNNDEKGARPTSGTDKPGVRERRKAKQQARRERVASLSEGFYYLLFPGGDAYQRRMIWTQHY